MDDGVKQRLVGALVLIALGVLFIPALFEPENRRQIDRTPQVPVAPTIEPLTIREPVSNPDIEPAKSPKDMYRLLPVEDPQPEPVKTAAKEAKPAPQKAVKLSDAGVPQGWVVQVASYNTPQAAKSFLGKLQKAGYPAFTKTLDTRKGTVTRIYAGPKISKDSAVLLQQELNKKYGLKTLVARFQP
ncbi:MAG: SPOR domain-containing protein [Candidatus Pelagadaptatus aseana]|uniref:SPOR domain-containing protein n=1 Tax=Candidatus Pelagadaptatus aseana TaxID=3120508 RepID=UPI0039B19919